MNQYETVHSNPDNLKRLATAAIDDAKMEIEGGYRSRNRKRSRGAEKKHDEGSVKLGGKPCGRRHAGADTAGGPLGLTKTHRYSKA